MSRTILDRNKVYNTAIRLNQIDIWSTAATGNIDLSDFSKDNRLVRGLLQDTLKFSLDADWAQVMNLNDTFHDPNAFLNLTNNQSLFTTGIATRRYYKGGSYLRIEPKIRVVNWDGTADTNVVVKALVLMNACLPSQGKSQFLSQVGDVVNKVINVVTDPAANSSSDSPVSSFMKPLGQSIQQAGTIVSDLIKQAITNNPQPVYVNVSNYFQNIFLIENVTVEFSKEMTETGPLYADFNLTLSTPEVVQRGQSGFLGQTNKRVSIIPAGLNPNQVSTPPLLQRPGFLNVPNVTG